MAAFRGVAELDALSRVGALDRLVVPVMERLGEAWENGRVSLSQVFLAGRLCEEVVDTVLPDVEPARPDQPRVAIATLCDHHVLGKRIVRSILRASGFEVVDLGHGLQAKTVAERVRDERFDWLLISTLMLPSALKVGELRDQLGPDIRIMVGGAPFRLDEQLYRDVGADAMGSNAGDAVRLLRGDLEVGGG
jgi:methanogenic corrinoid protein MtbC1